MPSKELLHHKGVYLLVVCLKYGSTLELRLKHEQPRLAHLLEATVTVG